MSKCTALPWLLSVITTTASIGILGTIVNFHNPKKEVQIKNTLDITNSKLTKVKPKLEICKDVQHTDVPYTNIEQIYLESICDNLQNVYERIHYMQNNVDNISQKVERIMDYVGVDNFSEPDFIPDHPPESPDDYIFHFSAI